MNLYIRVGSITNAQRGRRILKIEGYSAFIKKAENPSNSEGCGYALVVQADDEKPLEILRRSRIKILGVERT